MNIYHLIGVSVVRHDPCVPYSYRHLYPAFLEHDQISTGIPVEVGHAYRV